MYSQSTGDYRTFQTGVWSSATSWQTYNGSNWVNASAAPTAASGVITILSGHTITSNGTIAADQVVINSGGTLAVSGGTLTVNTATATELACNGTLTLSGGTLNGNGSVVINSSGIFNWSGGNVGGVGSFTINTGATCNMNSVFLIDNKVLNNYGAITWTGSYFYLSNAAVFNNYGTFNMYTDGDIYGGTSNNTAAIVNKPGGIINKIGSPNDETGINTISNFTNAGTININSSKLNLSSPSIHTGTVNIGFGAHLNFSSGASFLNAGTVLTGLGYLNFIGGADTINSAPISVKNISLTNATVALNTALTLPNESVFNQSGGTLTGTGNLNFSSGSTYNWSGGYLSGSGSLNLDAGSNAILDGYVYLTDTRTLNNNSTITWQSGNLYFTGAPGFNNNGVFNINSDNGIYASGSTTGIFNNSVGGIINKEGSPTYETSFNGIRSFTNAGTMNVNSGRLNLKVPSVHTGAINTAFGAIMAFSNENAIFNTGTAFVGDGYLNFESGTDTINAATILVKHININYATVTLIPAITIANDGDFSLSGGTLKGPGDLTFNSGSAFNWSGGYLGGSGTTTINTGVSFTTNGTVYLSDTRTINNYGTWDWTGGYIYFYNSAPTINNYGTFNISTDNSLSTYNTSTGTFNNMAGGVINKIGSPNYGTGISGIASFNNAGIININSGYLTLNVDGTHNGTYNVGFGAGLSGYTTLNFTGDTFTNDGTVELNGLTFGGTAIQSLNGIGIINTLTINNAVGVVLPESQTIRTNLTVKANSKLIVYRDLIKQ